MHGCREALATDRICLERSVRASEARQRPQSFDKIAMPPRRLLT